jgi:hypothetical protein
MAKKALLRQFVGAEDKSEPPMRLRQPLTACTTQVVSLYAASLQNASSCVVVFFSRPHNTTPPLTTCVIQAVLI